VGAFATEPNLGGYLLFRLALELRLLKSLGVESVENVAVARDHVVGLACGYLIFWG